MVMLKIAIIGLGGRGQNLYRDAIKGRKNVNVVALCDDDTDFWGKPELVAEIKEEIGFEPRLYTDYKECIDKEELDAVIIATGWRQHIEISMYAMEKGVAVGCEVGGAYSLESLWDLVRCYERTKTPIMMLENCCYGRLELLALNMKRLGLLGRIVHCEGGYHHDLRWMATFPKTYRTYEYIHRNSECYPTHEIGPIAKILDINCGNRFVSLTSVGTGAFGMEEYIQKQNIEAFKGEKFNQSDVVTTILKCANGETVTITLDTCLPRYYSRGFMVQGTKGLIVEENSSVHLEGDKEEPWNEFYNNVNSYYEKYEHPIWKGYKPGEGGHGGMDVLLLNAFFGAVEKKEPMPLDVYDMATWMAITILSEESMITGRTVFFPDFTNGKWISNKNNFAK